MCCVTKKTPTSVWYLYTAVTATRFLIFCFLLSQALLKISSGRTLSGSVQYVQCAWRRSCCFLSAKLNTQSNNSINMAKHACPKVCRRHLNCLILHLPLPCRFLAVLPTRALRELLQDLGIASFSSLLSWSPFRRHCSCWCRHTSNFHIRLFATAFP